MSPFELRPLGTEPQQADFVPLIWGAPRTPGTSVRADIDPWLSELGPCSEASIDLVRIAAAAYMADRQTPRGAGYTRTMRIHVQVTNADRWMGALDDLADLLYWLTGDVWEISVATDRAERPEAAEPPEERPDTVALLSGGLDSLAGALAATPDSRRLFLGHWDNPTVKASQDRTWSWLQNVPGFSGEYRQIHLCEAATKLEISTRSRCLLFFALATATATATGAGTVEVPENGFTSLNPSLGNDRGGVLSTRSTHPWTIFLFQQLLGAVGIDVLVRNPYELMTKGELVAAASKRAAIVEGVPLTLSCGKLGGHHYRGGNPNYNCGLCVACLTRRGALLSASIKDDTPYLMNTIERAGLPRLLKARDADLRAVRTATEEGFADEFALLAQGPFPETYDLAAAADLARRGIAELRRALP